MKMLFKTLAALLVLANTSLADLVVLKVNMGLLTAPKTTPITSNKIINAAEIRRRLDSTNDASYSDLGIVVDTLRKDEPWKLVYLKPNTQLYLDAPDKMDIDVLGVSQVGNINTITPMIAGGVFLLGTVTEYRVVRVALNIGGDRVEAYSAFNIVYRVVRTDTGDHWYPSISVSFRGPGTYWMSASDITSTCLMTMTLTPPKISMPTSTYWMPVNRNIIISTGK